MAKKPLIPNLQVHSLSIGSTQLRTQKEFNDYVLDRIKNVLIHEKLEHIHVFALGSLSYMGLTPFSDLDLLAVGSKEETEVLSQTLGKSFINLKIKYMPALNWEGVLDTFEHVSLFFSKAIFPEHQAELDRFLSEQASYLNALDRRYLQDLVHDRLKRKNRYGSTGGELSPNLKFSVGGLRDCCQGLAQIRWWADWLAHQGPHNDELQALFEFSKKALEDSLSLISKLRFWIQKEHQSDIFDMKQWKNISDVFHEKIPDLRFVYRALALSQLVCDALEELGQGNSHEDLEKIQDWLKGLSECSGKTLLSEILNESSPVYLRPKLSALAIQRRLSLEVEKSLGASALLGALDHIFHCEDFSKAIELIFESGLLELALPEWDLINGLTQSDHYHKFTVNEHLKRCVLAIQNMQNKRRTLFSVQTSSESLSSKDWAILKWTALFHDLCKGQEGSHSQLGADVVRNLHFTTDEDQKIIAYLVENHLALSNFAFRFEHSDQDQLQDINSHVEASFWLRLLLIFTCADIVASNPEAWNSWKSDQLYLAYLALMNYRNHKVVSEELDIEGFSLNSLLVRELSDQILSADILELKKKISLKAENEDISDWQVYQFQSEMWVRVFGKDKGPGTLSSMLSLLFFAGTPIEQSFVASSRQGYVYNWFRLPRHYVRSKVQIEKRIKALKRLSEPQSAELYVPIHQVQCLFERTDRLTFLFKGEDQKGVLLYICKIFENLGVNILKAQVNTWGNRVEDIFVVEKGAMSVEILTENLKQSLLLPQSITI